MLCAVNCWFDDINGVFLYDGENHTGWNDKGREMSYYVYPWNKEYLNNFNNSGMQHIEAANVNDDFSIEDINVSRTLKKVLANTRFSERTVMFDSPNDDEDGFLGWDELALKFVGAENRNAVKLGDNIFYKGFADELLTYNSEYVGYGFTGDEDQDNRGQAEFGGGTLRGYPLMVGGSWPSSWAKSRDGLIKYSKPEKMSKEMPEDQQQVYHYTPNCSSTSPILMRYGSSNHVVFRIGQTTNDNDEAVQNVLPIKESSVYSISEDFDNGCYVKDVEGYLWENDYSVKTRKVR